MLTIKTHLMAHPIKITTQQEQTLPIINIYGLYVRKYYIYIEKSLFFLIFVGSNILSFNDFFFCIYFFI